MKGTRINLCKFNIKIFQKEKETIVLSPLKTCSALRLIVLRLQSSVKSSYLTSLVEELEEAVKIFSVTVVLHHERLDPSSVVVATLPSRDVSVAVRELQALGYCGPPEPSSELSMREGEQLLLRFSGNITCNGISISSKSFKNF